MNESDTSRHFLRQWIEKDVADGKTGGKVVTRFPPEPNGYIHIGHAKAVCVDFGMAKLFNGECHLRLDDTNPTKESDEYAENIKKDINWLGFQWSGEGGAGEPGFYNASNMFDTMYKIAEELIRRGQAYCCNLTQDEWKQYRGVPEKPGTPSPSRDTDPERNLKIFHEMRDGKYADGEWCVRAKIDMASPNIHFRDPVIYRIRHVAHYHLGDKWCVYPMYDFAHPIEDALEGVTHSMCTLEFEVHRPLYDWVVDRMDEQGLLPVRNGVKIRTQQREFARLNLTYTVMSKRLLLQMVNEKVVDGWDDPRMPTVCGMRRRGYTPGAIREFCDRIGVSKVESESDPALLEWCVREELNQTATRRMAVLDPVKVVIDNWDDATGMSRPLCGAGGKEAGPDGADGKDDATGMSRPLCGADGKDDATGMSRPLCGADGKEAGPDGADGKDDATGMSRPLCGAGGKEAGPVGADGKEAGSDGADAKGGATFLSRQREVELPNNPMDESAGTRKLPFGKEIWIDRADFMEVPEKKFFRMTPGQEVRLRGACIFKCTGCVKDANGVVTEIHGTWDTESWGGNAADGRKVKGTIHWVDCATGLKAEVRLYDRLFLEKDPMKDGSENFLKYLNPDSLKVVTGYVEPALGEAKAGDHFQFERTGYFVCDGSLVFNRTCSLKDSYKPA